MQAQDEDDNSGQRSSTDSQFTPMRKKGKKKQPESIDEKVATQKIVVPVSIKKDISIE